ncbi:GspH/FimT family pseudopilin [Marinobacter salinisoli]|uniref:Type II secretion system protein H n=2 Tax=Marinobacter salinisoli TaxID=2769486 RepID=A0ABX7MUY3_9GAMM|nr:GspH/FimT family pseudopilin [Marinobacter salinisoli]
MKHPNFSAGFTLVELVLTLAILAIITVYALPSMERLVKKGRQHSSVSELIALINLARNTAITERVSVTLCPITANNKCGSDWTEPLVVFRDPLRTKTISDTDQIIRILALPASGSLQGNTGIRNYFRFRPTGLAKEAIGNIVWCPSDGDTRYASQIRINMGGRPLISPDTDGDGIPNGANGLPITCS